MKVQLLRTDGCGHGAEAEGLLREVLASVAPDAPLEIIEVRTEAQGAALRFAGSPTILVDGVDLENDPPLGSGFG